MKFFKVFPSILRSMFYQANWNVENMQGTGFSWLIKDLLRRNGLKMPADVKFEGSQYFNTNPYFITFILGLFLREAKNGERAGAYMQTYASALAALGDSFFWHALRPFTFFFAVWVALIEPIFTVPLYLILYNFFHFGFRFFGFYYGYKLGRDFISFFRRIHFNKWSQFFDSITTFMAGAAIAAVIRYQLETMEGFHIARIIILFILGVVMARRVSAPVGLMCVTGAVGIMLMAGI